MFRKSELLAGATVGMLLVLPAMAQQDSGSDTADLPESVTLPLPLGAAGKATVLSPNLRSTEATVGQADLRFLIPGCAEFENGIYLCGSVHEYQHCRTLMHSGIIDSCRAGVAFAGGFADPRAAEPGQYELAVESNAKVRVSRNNRGFGEIRGSARVVVRFDQPADFAASWCVQRDPFVYYPTGPEGGTNEIGEPGPCEAPIEFTFKPHADDLLRAHELCENFGFWGESLEDSIEVLAASLFEIRSASPEFIARYPEGSARIAPYATVRAPLTIDCRD